MLLHCVQEYRLVFAEGGRLRPWLGLALRGLVGLRFKEQVCRLEPAERQARRYCKGCPQMAGCPYGETLEPDPPAGRQATAGREDAVRPVVSAPFFPLPDKAWPGLEVPLRVVALGAEAVGHVPALVEALARAGQEQGVGEPPMRFALLRLEPAAASDTLTPAELPAYPEALPGRLPRVEVCLTAPLFLREQGPAGQRHRPVTVPSLADLVRASLRTVSELCRLYGQPLHADFAALRSAAERVPLLEHGFEPFAQQRHSNRGTSSFVVEGVVGGGVYGPVPLGLLPWLVWGGRFHVGGHRVAGAGGWRLLLD